ncbi:MAG: hypothetical protein HYS80_01330 [Candidatus Aenigmarchaeota archaeon]|nr:hypothetical protein [Candidatus Aenigmarchaeota archaeon]
MKNLSYRPLVTSGFTRIKPIQTALLCPACNSEIGLAELIERKGYVGCVNCSR